ncbi:hypothetical protein N431DRAFT_529050 [Stipitochalara longipes BDJ]|nr:hypothetical protein N431DRAFT_529050 [Stipitochalara longipes BDJ]
MFKLRTTGSIEDDASGRIFSIASNGAEQGDGSSMLSDTSDAIERDNFRLPSRPEPRPDNLKQQYKAQGLPEHASRLIHALLVSKFKLAQVIFDINEETADWSSLRFPYVENAVLRMSNALISMSADLCEIAAQGKLHTLHAPNIDKKLHIPAQHRINVNTKNFRQEERPVIYALSLGDKNGLAPTKEVLSKVLRQMELYIAEYPNNRLRKWQEADKTAREIDFFSPKDRDRDWSGGTRGEQAKLWQLDNHKQQRPHPRRYCITHEVRSEVKKLIKITRTRLANIPDSQKNDPLPWSLVYIGWTRLERRRVQEHHNHHGNASAVAYLVEACIQYLYPDSTYLLRSVTLVNVTEAEDAQIMEHGLSILAGSYTEFGGLNGTLGGEAGMLTRARTGAKSDTWMNGLRALAEQDVYMRSVTTLQARLQYDRLWGKYLEEGSEFAELDAAETLEGQSKTSLISSQKTLLKKCCDLSEAGQKQCDDSLRVLKAREELKDVKEIYESLAAITT